MKTKNKKPTLFERINIKMLVFILFIIPALFYSWQLFFGDIQFTSDIARDFLLFSEIDQKKIVLIGPKSSVMGLFHGPAWLYLNYPAYLIGAGNPIVLGAFWVILTVIFVFSCFYVGKKLFNERTGYLFALMVSLYMFFHLDTYFNPIGALFLIPINFYFFMKYLDKYELKYLILHVLTSGLIIHFEIAIGIPLYILSFTYLFFRLILSKKKGHILALFLILLPLINFIVFDVRHNFLIFNSVLRYLSPESGDSIKYNYLYMILDRLKLLTVNVELLRLDPNFRNAITGFIFMVFFLLQVKDNRYKKIYFHFLYFYVGFFVLTLINKGPILYFYFFPFFPFVFLIFSSFITSRYKNIFLIIFLGVFLLNVHEAFNHLNAVRSKAGRAETSWKFLNSMSNDLFKGDEESFGYYIYTPDVIGYGPKYAIQYQKQFHKNKNSFYFQKKPITYVLVAPPAIDNPYLSYDWWKTERLKISKKPVSTLSFENGYKIEKYELTDDEIKINHDPGIDPGLTFR